MVADWVNNRHIPRLQAVTRVTTPSCDVKSSWSTSIQHYRQTTAVLHFVTELHKETVSRSWNDTSDVCRRSHSHVTTHDAVRGEWTEMFRFCYVFRFSKVMHSFKTQSEIYTTSVQGQRSRKMTWYKVINCSILCIYYHNHRKHLRFAATRPFRAL